MADERQDERMLDWLRDGPWDAPAPAVAYAVAYAEAHPRGTSHFAVLRRVLTGADGSGEPARPAAYRARFVALGSMVAVVVVAAWIAAGSGLLGGRPGGDLPPGGAATASPSWAPTPTPAATFSPTSEPTPAPTAPPTPAPSAGTPTSSAIGQVVRSEDFTAKITSVDFDASGSPAPAAGKRYVTVGMTFTPRSGDAEEFEAADWTLREASGSVYQPVAALTTADTEVAAGRSLPARVTFLVPESATHLVLVAEEQTPASGLPLS